MYVCNQPLEKMTNELNDGQFFTFKYKITEFSNTLFNYHYINNCTYTYALY